MKDEIRKRLENKIDRRSFLRGSGLAAGALVGLAVASPLVHAQEQQQQAPPQTGETTTDEKKETKPNENADQNQSSGDSTSETKLDANGVEYRECPQCGSNMYRQGRTWTCENCGYSYVE
jgi:predicted RNA-binding Zn-ribbon protein involved in translation (DUF1610 family)